MSHDTDLFRLRWSLHKENCSADEINDFMTVSGLKYKSIDTEELSHNLVLTCRALPVLEDDTRLVSLVQNLDKRLVKLLYLINYLIVGIKVYWGRLWF